MACLPLSQSQGASVMKNWLPLVLGPELAIERMPAPVDKKAQESVQGSKLNVE